MVITHSVEIKHSTSIGKKDNTIMIIHESPLKTIYMLVCMLNKTRYNRRKTCRQCLEHVTLSWIMAYLTQTQVASFPGNSLNCIIQNHITRAVVWTVTQLYSVHWLSFYLQYYMHCEHAAEILWQVTCFCICFYLF